MTEPSSQGSSPRVCPRVHSQESSPMLSVQGSEHRQEWDPSGPSAEHQACIWTAPNIRVLGTRVLKISQKKQQNGNF